MTWEGSSVVKFPRGRLFALGRRLPNDELGRTLPAKACVTRNGCVGSTTRESRFCLLCAPWLNLRHIRVGGCMGGAGVGAMGGMTP